MVTNKVTIFVDESGDLGTAERYFVIAILVPQNSTRISHFMRRFCIKNNLQEVKASQLTFTQKQEIFNKLNSVDDYTVSYIVADKQNIDNKKLFEDKNLLYNYLFSHLIKKSIVDNKEDISIILDNHSVKVKSGNSLCDYIKIKAFTQWDYQSNLDIRYTDSKNSKNIQAIDVIANAIYAHYTYDKSHFYNMVKINEAIEFPHGKFNLN